MTDEDIQGELEQAIAALHAQFNDSLTDGAMLRLLPERLRDAYRRHVAARPPVEGPLVQEFPLQGMRFTPSPSDDDIARAVLAAQAVVALDKRGWRQRQEIAKLQAQVAELRGSVDSGREERAGLRRRLSAITTRHAEAETVVCGDGCCHEGLGWCTACGEDAPFPCVDYRLASGERAGT